MDLQKQVDYWIATAQDSWESTECPLKGKRYSFAAFSSHLALEKVLKAHVAKTTGGVPPKIHDLKRLAEIAKLDLSASQVQFLDRYNRYQLEARYPTPGAAPDAAAIRKDIAHAKEVSAWLMKKLWLKSSSTSRHCPREASTRGGRCCMDPKRGAPLGRIAILI